MRIRRAFTVVELLATMMVLTILSAIAFQGFLVIGAAQKTATNLPPVQEDALRLLTMVTDDLKDAVICTATTGCTTNSAIHSAATDSVALYVDAAGTRRTYKRSGTTFQRLEGTSTTPSLTIPDVSALSFRYYTISGGVYNATSAPTTWSTSIASGSLTTIAAVRVTVTITRGGLSSTQTTDLRLRNSPHTP